MTSKIESAYLTGPMTGKENHNHDEFHRIAKILRDAGIEIDNPAEHFGGVTDGIAMSEFLRADINAICKMGAVIVMPGWPESRGSNIEILFAWYCGIPVYSYCEVEDGRGFVLLPIDTKPSILPYQTDTADDKDERSICEIADSLINGARRSTYGHPLDDYSRVAGCVNSNFSHYLRPGQGFKAEDIPIIIEFMKISRETFCPKRGNRVDGCGYWGVIEMIHEERARRLQTKPVDNPQETGSATV